MILSERIQKGISIGLLASMTQMIRGKWFHKIISHKLIERRLQDRKILGSSG